MRALEATGTMKPSALTENQLLRLGSEVGVAIWHFADVLGIGLFGAAMTSGRLIGT